MVRIEKARIGGMKEDCCANYFIEHHQRRSQYRLGAVLCRHGIAGRIERVYENRSLLKNRVLRDRTITGFHASFAKTVSHPTVGFRADQLVWWGEVPDVDAADLEVSTGALAENSEDFGGGNSLGSCARELKQQLLKRVVLNNCAAGSQCLFRTLCQ